MFYDIYETLCAENDISESKAAENIGLNRSAVVKWKNGSIPNSVTIQKLASYFGVSADYLIGNVSEPFFYLDNERIKREINSYGDDDEQEEKKPIQMDEPKIKNPDIRMIARAGKKMTPEQAENLRKYAQYMFPEAFEDDNNI